METARDCDSLPGLVVSSLPPPGYPVQKTIIYLRRQHYNDSKVYAKANAMADWAWCFNDSTGESTGKCKMDEPLYQPWYGTIRINTNNPEIQSFNEQQKQRLVEHEVGHVMGLDHRYAWPWEHCLDTVMQQGAYDCVPLVFRLSAQDRDRLNSLYPPIP